MGLSPISRRVVLVVLLFVLPAPSHADSWARPSLQVVSSGDGRALARLAPGHIRQRSPGEATLYVHDAEHDSYRPTARFKLRNRVAPVRALLTGKGELVTLDEWAGMGYGTVLVVYRPDGTPRLELSLQQLLGTEAADSAPRSVSSIRWRCHAPKLSQDDRQLLVDTYDEGTLEVELMTGAVTYTPGNGRCG